MPSGRVDHVSVIGFVVREGKTLQLRLADGSLLDAPRSSRLKVGALAHVVVRFSATGPTVVVPAPPSSGGAPAAPHKPGAPGASHCARTDCSFDVTGVVAAVANTGALTINPLAGGDPVIADPGQIAVAGVSVGDFVHVVGTQSAATGADTITSLVELPGCDNLDCSVNLDVYVDEVDPGSLIVEDDAGDQYQVSATCPAAERRPGRRRRPHRRHAGPDDRQLHRDADHGDLDELRPPTVRTRSSPRRARRWARRQRDALGRSSAPHVDRRRPALERHEEVAGCDAGRT